MKKISIVLSLAVVYYFSAVQFAFSNFPALLDLTSLNGTNGFALYSEKDDFLSVSSAGDVNDDGFSDIIIYGLGGTYYVVFGKLSGFPTQFDLLSLDGSNGFIINAEGGRPHGINDINGDDIDDFSVAHAVIFGNKEGFPSPIELSSLDGTNGFVVLEGWDISSAGDLNGDGINDIIFSGAGSTSPAYVIYGTAKGFPYKVDVSLLDGTNGFTMIGIDSADLGRSHSYAGDVNGDGLDDVIIGSPNNSQAFVVYGTTQQRTFLDLSSLNSADGFTINGAGRYIGAAVSTAGDVNADGIADIIIGAPTINNRRGQCFVIFGRRQNFPTEIDTSVCDGTNGFIVNGVYEYDAIGFSFSKAGDINADQIDDIIIGSSRGLNGDPKGQVFVIYGTAQGFPNSIEVSSLDGTNGFAIFGIDVVYLVTVSSAGDVNGDGQDDIIMGSKQAYVLFGETKNQIPIAICQNMTVSADPGFCSAEVLVDNGSFDPDGDPITLEQTPLGPYELGDTDVTLTVTDDKGASDTCDATVTVIDEEDPVISSVTASPNKLWPPNHKMVPVTVTVNATDNCDSACQINSVASNEPVNSLGDGDTAPDWIITGDLTVELRAERSGKGNGRIYTITVECADSSGNSSTDIATVTVLHDKGKK